MTKLRILLADDHAVVRAGLKALIDAEPDMEVVGEASDGRSAWMLARTGPEVVVMDVSMPVLGGAGCHRADPPGLPERAGAGPHRARGRWIPPRAPEGGGVRLHLEAGGGRRARACDPSGGFGGVYIDPKLAVQFVAGIVGPRPRTGGPKKES